MLLFIYIPKRRKCFGLLIRLIVLSTVFTISSNILQRPYFFYKKKKKYLTLKKENGHLYPIQKDKHDAINAILIFFFFPALCQT